ncbi:MAG: AAA family ATPase [Clostridia bacterium]|nr:AAA family ATPase [Clostridia bacterium]
MPSERRQPRALLPVFLCVVILLVFVFWQGRTTPSQADALPYGLLLLALVGGMLLGRGGAARRERSFAHAAGAVALAEIPPVRFADVAANEEAMNSLRDLVDFIRRPEAFVRMGARIPRGVLLHGLPGTGKTLMARALAGEAGVPFFAVNGADFVEMYVGVGASRIRSLFAKARKAGRAVVFIDEIDAIGKKRDNRSDEREQTLNALLSEMSGFHDGHGVVVLAATNRIDTLDEALLRAGRFDRQIEVPLPGLREREMILSVHARTKPMDPAVDLTCVAAQTALFSGAKLEGLLNEAAILAVKRGGCAITRQDIDTAMDTLLFGQEQTLARRQQEREVTAAHEAAHALATAVLLPESSIRKVSIIPTGRGAAGYSMAVPPEKLFHRKQELLHHIAVALIGREAEMLLLGSDHVTNGAANDIEKAALLAQRMVCEWGMLPGSEEPYLFAQPQKDAAAQRWLQLGQQLAAGLLHSRRAQWEQLTRLLLEKEVIGESEIRAVLSDTQPPVPSGFPCTPAGC